MSDILNNILAVIFLGIIGILCLFICLINTLKDILKRLEEEDD